MKDALMQVPEELVNQAQQALQHYFLGWEGLAGLEICLVVWLEHLPSGYD
jgi:hypothetical protein